jgi:DNA helicase-2/ATP-dependent DNA helicase PcrA
LIKALAHIGEKYGDQLRERNQKVACITYTEVAVGEILSDVGINDLFHVSTIHSFLWSLAKPFQRDIAGWVRRRIAEKLAELREERGNFGPRVRQTTRDRNQRDIVRLESHAMAISNAKRFKYESGSDYGEGILGHDDIVKMVPQFALEHPLLATIIAQKYPFFFVDESQDTFPQVVEALKAVARQNRGKFCLGFFGDPMQQIYMHGVGAIPPDDGWKKITKPENFRCPATVLSTINGIRARGDGLKQTRGRQQLCDGVLQPVAGTANLFVLPADHRRDANLGHVRAWLAKKTSDALWASDTKEADLRILVIVHRMAAARLGFPDLYAAFNDNAPDTFSTGFREGNAWAMKAFLDVLIPLVRASAQGQQFEVMKLLRAHCPALDKERLNHVENPATVLAALKETVRELGDLMSSTAKATVLDVLQFVDRVQLIKLDERVRSYIVPPTLGSAESESATSPNAQDAEDSDADMEGNAMRAYLACPAKQLSGYFTYISDESPYSTQQGIKGAEFERVIVVVDDEEGRHFQFSYDKLLGLREPSKTDIDNERHGKETILDRTRRLFYVCCSRAKSGLAVILYTSDVQTAATRLKDTHLFDPGNVYTLNDML